MKNYYVYMMASPTRVLYVGVTNDLDRRVWEHKTGTVPGFTSQYQVTRLVWMEEYNNAREAIAREKQIKGWRRQKKIALIESANSNWRDLSNEWLREQRKGVGEREELATGPGDPSTSSG